MVVALLVDAFEIAKLEVEPNNVVMLAEIADSTLVNKLVSTFRLVIDDVAETSELVFKLVEVELVIVPLVVLIDGRDRLVIERLVIVALVIVAFEIDEEEALLVEASTVVSCVVPVALMLVKFPVLKRK